MITIADIPTCFPTDEAVEWVRRYIRTEDASQPAGKAFPGKNLTGISFPEGFRIPRPIDLGTFSWPRGASRYAIGHFLISSNQADQIRTAAWTNGPVSAPDPQGGGAGGSCSSPQSNTAVTLYLDAPNQTGSSPESISTQVYIRNLIPLGRMDPDDSGDFVNGLYMVTVVDVRYFWQYLQVPDFSFSTSTTWANLLTSIGTVLGVTINVDSVNAVYKKPSPSLNLRYENLPLVLDAIAANIGCRIVRKFDGSVWCMSEVKSGQVRDADDAANPDRKRLGGGLFYQDVL